MRGSILGSGLTHVLLLAAAFIVRPAATFVVPGPEVIQVALLDPSAQPPSTPAPPEPAKEPEPAPEVKPVEDTGVKIAPPRRPERKKEKKVEKAPRPAPQTVAPPTLPAARVGPAGLSGDVAVDAGNFEFTYYLVLVRNRIAANWSPPAGLSTGGSPVRAVIYFRVGRGGELSGVRMETGSGVEFFDRSAMRAVTLSDPLPPLPLGFAGGELGVHFGFEWESP
jgi:TonB family protein